MNFIIFRSRLLFKKLSKVNKIFTYYTTRCNSILSSHHINYIFLVFTNRFRYLNKNDITLVTSEILPRLDSLITLSLEQNQINYIGQNALNFPRLQHLWVIFVLIYRLKLFKHFVIHELNMSCNETKRNETSFHGNMSSYYFLLEMSDNIFCWWS